jgi:UDP:flavonoid glycosyltransferase YjiC (YdhE family)
MRVLFTACPLHGHVNTLLPLAQAAQRSGHEAIVATGADLVPHVERHGLAAWPVGPTHREGGNGSATPWIEYFLTMAERRAHDLVPRAAEWRPDLVVSEETELAGPVAAAAAGARRVVHGLGQMPPIRIWDAFAPTVEALHQRWGVSGGDALRDETYLDVCPPSLQPEGERIWPHSRPIRPLPGLPVAGERLPGTLTARRRERTVHLTLGTVFHDAPAVFEAALAGLRRLPIDLVVTTGPGTDPERFGPQPANVLLAPYLPHALLLPRCRLVVSHGGAGIMFGALAHGLPQLVLPQGADQFMNADAVRRTGSGLVLEPGHVTADAVAAAAGRLLTEPSFSAAAARLGAEISAMPGPDEVLAALWTDGDQTSERMSVSRR